MKNSEEPKPERRRFLRVKAPVLYRVPRMFTHKRRVSNISPAGVRIYSDERLEEGKQLELEFFLPSGRSVTAIANVMWIKELPPEAEGRFDIGLEFVYPPPIEDSEVKSVLEQEPSED